MLFFLLAAALAAAEPASLDERLRALESKVDALQTENAELRRALSPPATATPAHGTAPEAPADPLMPAGKETRVVIGGFTQAQAEFGGAGDARFAGTSDRVYFRRARLFLAGSFAEHFEFKIEGEFGAGSVTPGTGLRAQTNDTYLGWNRYPEATVRVGQLKPAFAAELLAIEYKGPLIERSLGAERIADGRQLGAEIAGDLFGHRAGYLVFVGNGSGSNSSANDNNKFLQTARVYAAAFDSKDTGRLTLGADALHSTDAALGKLGPGFDAVPGGAVDNLFTGTRSGWGLDATWHCGLLDLSSELLRMRYRPANRIPNQSFTAESWQLTAAYFLLPNQLQAAVRREHFDPNTARGGDATNNWLLGLDYYLKGEDLKLMVDYLLGRAPGLSNAHGRLLTRFQIVY
jgi:phosphate-selective porin OprO and OprP